MKLLALLPLAALSTAFVIPDDEVMNQIALEPKTDPKSWFDKLPSPADILSSAEETIKSSYATAENALDVALDTSFGVVEKANTLFHCTKSMVAFDVQSWLDSAVELEEDDNIEPTHPHHPPRHRRPHHPRHHKPNLTVYELINESKYTTKFAKLINEYDDLVDILNSTSTNITVFVPTDKAFEKLHKHHSKPDKQLIRNILAYHFSPDFYPAGRVLVSHTIPSTYREQALGGEPQRLRLALSLRGLTVNFYSRVIAANIFGTNGVIHGVDSILFPPPSVLKIISLLPGEFSTTQLALVKSGIADHDEHGHHHTGATFFAPSNWAWKKLGPRINAFLFSTRGEKYLKALLKYHVVANQTLYSDAFYGPKKDDLEGDNIPKGVFHVDLPTLLKDHSLSVDVARWGGLINIRINGYNDVTVEDGIAQDGVIQVPRSVLIPPRHPHGAAYQDEELTVEDLMERLEPYIEDEEEVVQEKSTWFDL